MALRLAFLSIPFLAARRMDWMNAWLLTALVVSNIAFNLALLLRLNPEVIRLRMQPVRPERLFDRFFAAAGLVLFLIGLIVAGIDAGRGGWSPMNLEWTALGVAMYLAGMVPVTWSLAVNRFLSTTVSIQTERGHSVVSSGPYRIVRHPMYSGLLVVYLSVPLILGSWWAFIPMATMLPLLVFRTLKEDATLRAELAGYEEYARQTRFRLVAGLW